MKKANSTQVLAPDPTILVIFGITGDLSKRFLLPSLYHLIKEDMLNSHTEIVGVTRGDANLDELLSSIELCVSEIDGVCDPSAVKKLKSCLSLHKMDLTNAEDYMVLYKRLNELENQHGVCMNRLYYLSVPPMVTEPIIRLLDEGGLNKSCQHGKASTRVLIEKPFGYDTESAKELIKATSGSFNENQIFRIDHYLAKTTVQNILAFRSTEPHIEKLWNGKHIKYIEVLADEKIGIENRVSFYEKVGALRDFVQSHLIQILALTTMEIPKSVNETDIHRNKLKILKKIQSVPQNQVSEYAVRGQYDGYRKEVDNPSSTTETFAAIQLKIDNKKWRNTPMIIRTGKELKNRLSEVNVVFKDKVLNGGRNKVTLRIQPNESIELKDTDDKQDVLKLAFKHDIRLKDGFLPNAYEKILVDSVKGDHTLFSTSDEILETWRVVQPVLDEWAKSSADLTIYKKGSDGPSTSKIYPK